MKHTILIILMSTWSHFGFGQKTDVHSIKYKGLDLYSSKAEIVEKLGPPLKIYEPNYECGFLSSEEQGKAFYTLDYGNLKFTGNDKDEYLLEEILFEKNDSIVLSYGEFDLSNQTELSDLVKIFGEQLPQNLDQHLNGFITIRAALADDSFEIEVNGGRIIKISYWSPC